MVKYKVDIVSDQLRFAALREDWQELQKNSVSDCLFLTWEWLYTWWKHLAEDLRLHILTLRENEQLIAIAPFARRSSRWQRLLPFPALEFLGTGSVGSDYLDVLLRRGHEKQALLALAEYLTHARLMYELSSMEKNIAQGCKLAQEMNWRGWKSTQITTDICPYIDLTGHDWQSYLATLSAAHRYNLRRRSKNMQKRWETRFDLARDEQQRAEALQILIALHGKRWRERGSPGAFHSRALVAFHEELTQLALQLGWLRLYILRLDGEPAAALYGFLYQKIFYFYQSGLNLDFLPHSVGLVTMGLVIENAIAEGAKSYDFLRGDESYKSLWSRTSRELIRTTLYPPGLRGAFYKQTMDLRSNIKRMSKMTSMTTASGGYEGRFLST